MIGQRFGVQENDVHRRVEVDGPGAADVQPFFRLDGGDGRPDIAGIEGHRVFARQPQLDGDVGTMPFARLCQGTIKHHGNGPEAAETMAFRQRVGKTLRSAPGTESVGTGGTNANLKHVENGDTFVRQDQNFGKGKVFSNNAKFTAAESLCAAKDYISPVAEGENSQLSYWG